MKKKVLMIAYHYPPCHGSSGIQRSLKYSRYLPENGWQPIVLSANERAYEQRSYDLIEEVHQEAIVRRAFALDSARHLAFKGKYPGFLALPDRWITWWLGGVATGLRLIRKYKPDVIWSTYPIATAHLIGLSLKKLTGLPWVADFRDSMTDDAYPEDPKVRTIYKWIEESTVKNADRNVFTAPSAAQMYRERYKGTPENKWSCLLNGYDENNFSIPIQEKRSILQNAKPNEKILLLHSGILYPSERDPTSFFTALAVLKKKQLISSETLEVRLRASHHEDTIKPLVDKMTIGDIVSFAPPIGYHDAIAEMNAADGLLIFQASNCNHQIPAKIYEYFRTQKPILALTDPRGDTAWLMKSNGMNSVSPLNSSDEIEVDFLNFIDQIRSDGGEILNKSAIEQFSRRNQTALLGKLLDDLI